MKNASQIDSCGVCRNCKHVEATKTKVLRASAPAGKGIDTAIADAWNETLKSFPCTSIDENDDFTHLGDSMYCPRCDDYRICARVNAPPRNAFDPTETYTLECGHTVLGCEQPD